jgi:hypothetical protein
MAVRSSAGTSPAEEGGAMVVVAEVHFELVPEVRL